MYVEQVHVSRKVLKISNRAVASAVILPEDVAEQPPPASPTLKRRQSSFSDERSKRPRLSSGGSNDKQDVGASPPAVPVDRASDRRKSGQMEERKRGQRLFGALLGTLSQSSSSTAQKRRTDIEKKQQAKLKLQAEEQDEKKKQRREALMEMRKREQVKYDKQSVRSALVFNIIQAMVPDSNYALDANTTFKYARSGALSLHENSTETCRLPYDCSLSDVSDLFASTTNHGSSYQAMKRGSKSRLKRLKVSSRGKPINGTKNIPPMNEL